MLTTLVLMPSPNIQSSDSQHWQLTVWINSLKMLRTGVILEPSELYPPSATSSGEVVESVDRNTKTDYIDQYPKLLDFVSSNWMVLEPSKHNIME
jgi:hypothetical protein